MLISEACKAGCRIRPACDILSITIRTYQRWKKMFSLKDKRGGPAASPANKLNEEERGQILAVANSLDYQDLSPTQIVPTLADKGQYLASESTIYRILKAQNLLQHRSACRPKKHKRPNAYTATQPNELWSWDITYLRTNIRGKYFYLYLFIDIFSRKIVGFEVFEQESATYASQVVYKAYCDEGVKEGEVTLHSDNGGPMKGSMMTSTLQNLGIGASFSRPSVSNDNPFSESLFRTLKYCPKYPKKPFESLEQAQEWVRKFVHWYNNIHRHSSIKFITPNERHLGLDKIILEKRKEVYENAKQKNPNRWSGNIRNWSFINEVNLNKINKKCNSA